jgi:hypothetical protein
LILYFEGFLYDFCGDFDYSLLWTKIEIDFGGMVECSDQEHSNERTNDYDSNLYCLLDFYCFRSCYQRHSHEFNSAKQAEAETQMEMERRGRRT